MPLSHDGILPFTREIIPLTRTKFQYRKPIQNKVTMWLFPWRASQFVWPG